MDAVSFWYTIFWLILGCLLQGAVHSLFPFKLKFEANEVLNVMSDALNGEKK